MAERNRGLRCAVYTRKSSENNLDLEFNSLDAQREAAEAYIKSQAHEGWRLLKTHYDDGGVSGGTMERPALQRLLADIAAGLIDVVVVYKVDRLTRSLADFAKLVDLFDRHQVSFVSVTQQFNTTTSMGRLTLNVLLSFAQFEREVAGERIRDKVAASRRKGMWMGGHPPLGYDVRDKRLVPNEMEAAQVYLIFQRYLELGCVSNLKLELDAKGITSKRWVTASSKRTIGGQPFSRGALYHLLRNRVYVGEAVHKGQAHPGEHGAIVERAMFDAVQARLKEQRNAQYRRRDNSAALLAGLIFDDRGNRMSPSWSCRRGGRYRYYVSQAVLQGRKAEAGTRSRVAAVDLERRVVARLQELAASTPVVVGSSEALSIASQGQGRHPPDPSDDAIVPLVRSCVRRITVRQDTAELELDAAASRRMRTGEHPVLPNAAQGPGDDPEIERTTILVPRSQRVVLHRPASGDDDENATIVDRALVTSIARARSWARGLKEGNFKDFAELAQATGHSELYIRRIIRLAWLAPDIVQAFMEGRHPRQLTRAAMLNPLPFDWAGQRRTLGVPAADQELLQ